MKLLVSLIVLIVVSSCSRDTDYLIYEEPLPPVIPPQAIEEDARVYPLKDLNSANNVDILFVVDNSGSMGGIQANVANNAEVFMREFALNSILDWKIGIVSTDQNESPYLGFTSAFDKSLIDPVDPSSFDLVVDTFATSIKSLGTSGDFNEYVFYNANRAITSHNFLRKNSHFVIIMITDEDEQSEGQFGANYRAINLLNNFSSRLTGGSILRFYGALAAGDLTECRTSMTYRGSPFEEVINTTGGFVISACINDFGNQLASIGQDIANLANAPKLALLNRPVIKSITVEYKGTLLKAGRPENGGVWYYDYNTNTINFYTLDFAEDLSQDSVIIDFDVDDGIDRD